ncbi:MAG: Ig-like domain-containing protein [Pseudomonadales bacterium]
MSRKRFVIPIAMLLLCLSGCSDDNDSDDGPVPTPDVPTMDPPASGPFVVSETSPEDAAEVDALPASIIATFNRAVADGTLGAEQVTLQGSGGDGTFADGNEVDITPTSVSVSEATATIDLTDVTAGDDSYQLTLIAATITDADGVVLDGDGDGTDGGDFVSTFTVAAAAPAAATFSFIQDNVFTPSCATIGCHTGASPAAGQNLSAGEAFANIVGIPSGQAPALQRVNPGNADDSYLVRKIEGGPAIVNNQMPLGRPPLSSELIEAVRSWIDAGAENN